MSLTARQQEDTRRELRENLERSGLTVEEVALDLDTTPEYVRQLFDLAPIRLEDTWILRNLLVRAVEARGGDPVPFTALTGDWHDYWFLDGGYIDDGRIGK